MTTNNKTSPAAHAAPGTGAGLTMLDPSAGYITIINTYAVAPERAEALLDFLVRATNETIRYVPGFVSANLHVNFDRTQVGNYAQWLSREAIAAARENPSRSAHARATSNCGQFHADPIRAASVRGGGR
jgi:heme-degrading monooxygenase HmoA